MRCLSFILQNQQGSTSAQRRKKKEVGSQLSIHLHQLTEGAKQRRMSSEQTRHFLLPVQRLQIQFPMQVKLHLYRKGRPSQIAQLPGCQACTKLYPGMTGEKGHKAPWSHRPASPRALLLHQSDFQQQEIWITQAHGDAEAETKS